MGRKNNSLGGSAKSLWLFLFLTCPIPSESIGDRDILGIVRLGLWEMFRLVKIFQQISSVPTDIIPYKAVLTNLKIKFILFWTIVCV